MTNLNLTPLFKLFKQKTTYKSKWATWFCNQNWLSIEDFIGDIFENTKDQLKAKKQLKDLRHKAHWRRQNRTRRQWDYYNSIIWIDKIILENEMLKNNWKDQLKQWPYVKDWINIDNIYFEYFGKYPQRHYKREWNKQPF